MSGDESNSKTKEIEKDNGAEDKAVDVYEPEEASKTSKRAAEDSDPEPVLKKKISFGLTKPSTGVLQSQFKKSSAISIKLGNSTALGGAGMKPVLGSKSTLPLTGPSKLKSAAAVFNDDDDDEEEMPPEAKMRMKNIGRNTPTSAGPNSFGKSRFGFCDSRKIFDKNMKEVDDDGQGPAD